MKLYHGTCQKRCYEYKTTGLSSPFLTNSLEVAKYYAEQCAELDNSIPIILEVEVDESNLEYDKASMDEPVKAKEELRDKVWQEISDAHPEWVKDNLLFVPSSAWHYSLKAVNSVRYNGIIAAAKITAV